MKATTPLGILIASPDIVADDIAVTVLVDQQSAFIPIDVARSIRIHDQNRIMIASRNRFDRVDMVVDRVSDERMNPGNQRGAAHLVFSRASNAVRAARKPATVFGPAIPSISNP